MTYPTGTIEKRNHNSRLPCKVKGCYETRYRYSGYCQYHDKNWRLWGSPYASACVPDNELTYYFDLIEHIIQANPNHRGVKRAEGWFEKGMVQGNVCRNMQPPYLITPARQWWRMYDQEVSPHDCLVTAASVWALSASCFPYHSKTGLIKSDRHAQYLLGHKVIKLTKFHKGEVYVSAKERRQMGRTVIDGVGPVLVSLSDAIKRYEEEKQVRSMELSEGFDNIPV